MSVTILIVEDERSTSLHMQKTLQKCGYHVSGIAETGEAAIEFVEREPPSIVLMDLTLTGARIQGLEAAKIIYDRYDVPAILVSSFDDSSVIRIVKDSQAFGYVFKPADERELKLSVELTLHKHKLNTELRDNAARVSANLDAALDAIITIDHRGHIVEFNAAAEDTFGYSRAKLMGKPMSEYIIPPAYREKHREGMRRYLKTGYGPVLGQRIEIEAMHSSGTIFPVELTVSPFKSNNQHYFTAYLRDISQRKQAELEVAYNNKLLRGAAEAANLLLQTPDFETALNAALAALGQAANIHDIYIMQLIPSDGPDFEENQLFAQYHEEKLPDSVVIAKQTEFMQEPAFKRWRDDIVSGAERQATQDMYPPLSEIFAYGSYKSILVAPIKVDDMVWGFIAFCDSKNTRAWTENERSVLFARASGISGAIARKLTLEILNNSRQELSRNVQSLKEREKELSQTTAALVQQEKLANLGSIAAGIAHEINSPLGAILNSSERLRTTASQDPMAQKNIELIIRGAERCRSIVQRFLLSARPSGKNEICILKTVIEDWFELHAKQLELYNIAWEVELEEDCSVAIGYSECTQILTNIILNARDALIESKDTKDGMIRVAVRADGAMGTLSVSDNGPGIPQTILPAIFEPFVTSKETGKGTGLGLWITHKIVSDAGGEILARNSSKGALFEVRLKLAAAKTARSAS